MLGGIAGVDGGEIGCESDVGDDHVQIVFIDYLANIVLDARDVIVGHLETRAGGRLEVDDELPGIGAGEEGDTQERKQARGYRQNSP